MSTGDLLVDVAALLRHPNERRSVQIGPVIDDLAISASRVPEGRPVEVDLLLESMPSGLRATGRVSAPWGGACRRCLEPVVGRIEATVDEVFEVRPTDEETAPIDDGRIDLEPVVREAVLLTLPLAPLCDDACRGPAPDRFPAVLPDDTERDADEDRRDPRWAALDDLDLP